MKSRFIRYQLVPVAIRLDEYEHRAHNFIAAREESQAPGSSLVKPFAPERFLFVQKPEFNSQSISATLTEGDSVNPETRADVGMQAKAHPPLATGEAINADETEVTSHTPAGLHQDSIRKQVIRLNGCESAHPNKIGKNKLVEFWNRFGGRRNNGLLFQKEDKLSALKEMAEFVTPYIRQQPLYVRRAKFQITRHKLCKLYTHKICFGCGGAATNRHHIIQLQNGGINSKKNVIRICETCHAEIHPWLKAV